MAQTGDEAVTIGQFAKWAEKSGGGSSQIDVLAEGRIYELILPEEKFDSYQYIEFDYNVDYYEGFVAKPYKGMTLIYNGNYRVDISRSGGNVTLELDMCATKIRGIKEW